VAISSVADMVPLTDESRVLTKFGLVVLNKTLRPGLRKLYETAGIVPGKIDTWTVGFQIAPRINAAGRMDHANNAFALLNAVSETEAANLAIALNAANSERQKVTAQMMDEAREQIMATDQEDAPVIIVKDERWPAGLAGLVAGKIMDEYGRPAFVFTRRNDSELVGSGRSIQAVSIIAAIQSLAALLLRFGGHPQAAGLSVSPDRFDEFKARLSEIVGQELAGKDLTPEIQADAEIPLSEVGWELQAWLEKFAPFGMKNPAPVFVSRNLTVTRAEAIGANGKHLRLSVCENGGAPKRCIAFSFGDWAGELAPGDKIDAAYEVSVNEWNGNRELQLKILDLTRT
jgi:single-stranded-DNA-specific exonuclease